MDAEDIVVWVIYYTRWKNQPLLCAVFKSEQGAEEELRKYQEFLEKQNITGYYWIGIESLKP